MAGNDSGGTALKWWGWIAAVFAGFFLANTIPHMVMGITGQEFPTAFSGGPPNLSSATTNVIWASINLIVGLVLLRSIRHALGSLAVQVTILAAGIAFALMLAWAFSTMM